MGHELTKKNITLFAEGVMPKLRQLWQDEGWEHRWWPQGARRDARQDAGRDARPEPRLGFSLTGGRMSS